MRTFALGFVLGFLSVVALPWLHSAFQRTRDYIREKRGIPCPRCGGDGYIEEAHVESRPVALWPCTCRKGRAWVKAQRERKDVDD